jgi:hypothetical protein
MTAPITRDGVVQATNSVLRYVATRPFVFSWETAYQFLLRAHDDAMTLLATTEARARETSAGLAAYSVVMNHIQQHRQGLSVREDGSLCVLEQDGTRLHCAPSIHDLADWCHKQTVELEARWSPHFGLGYRPREAR